MLNVPVVHWRRSAVRTMVMQMKDKAMTRLLKGRLWICLEVTGCGIVGCRLSPPPHAPSHV